VFELFDLCDLRINQEANSGGKSRTFGSLGKTGDA
jgi:hypothetical protein